jgi:hypothetical protein
MEEISFEHLFDSPFAAGEEEKKDDEKQEEEIAAGSSSNDSDITFGDGEEAGEDVVLPVEPQEKVARDVGEKEPPGDDVQASPNLYSSIARALFQDGFLTLDEKELEGVDDATGLAGLLQKQVDTLLDEKQRRVTEALSAGMPADKVREIEQTLGFLEGITEDQLKNETTEGEQFRGNIIFQDFINRGFSKARAEKEVRKSISAGTDVEDALEALEENKKFFKEKYDGEVKAREKEREDRLQRERDNVAGIEKMILETKEPLPGVSLTELQRKKLLGTWKNFVGKDEEGKPVTAIQKYALEHPKEYQYNVALLFELTKGFTDFSPVADKVVKKKTRTALSDIEKVLTMPTDRIGLGGLSFGNDKSPDSRYTVALD